MEFLDVGMVCSPERFIPQLAIDHLLIQKIPMRFFISNAIGTGAASCKKLCKSNVERLLTEKQILFDDG